MSELALQLIMDAKEKRLTRLDLGRCGLRQIPSELFELVWLEELILSNEWIDYDYQINKWTRRYSKNQDSWNQIQIIPEEIKKLKDLKVLILSGNRIKNIKSICRIDGILSLKISYSIVSDVDLKTISKLPELLVLDISNTLTNYVNPNIEFKKLKRLDIRSNSIFDVKFLENMENLISLDMFDNNIKNIEPISNLGKLQSLYLKSNQVNDTKSIGQLVELKFLNIASNQIRDITSLYQLKNLEYLDISSNQINDVTSLNKLKNLVFLDMSSNRVNDITPLNKLENLISLNISANQINDIASLNKINSIKSLQLTNTKISDLSPIAKLFVKKAKVSFEYKYIVNPPSYIIEQGNEAILDYFKSLEEQGSESPPMSG